ncbi:MAG: hypothetical protein QME66_00470 [Candidatus Eisenbacteria bacterium]|nr:hypothetical protein [Candidatus Eisenbacteria bacterium]
MRFYFLLPLILIPSLLFAQSSDMEPVTVGFVPNGNQVSMIDLSWGKVIYKLYTGQAPARAVVSPDKKYVWVLNTGSGKTTVIDLTKRGGFAKVEISNMMEPIWPVAFEPAGKSAYGISLKDSALLEIDCTSFEVKSRTRLPAPDGVRGLAITPDRKKLYVIWGNALSTAGLRDYITVFDPSGGKEIGKIPGGKGITALKLSSDGKILLALDAGSSEVLIIDTGNDRVVKRFGVGPGPLYMFSSPDWSKLVVTCGSEIQLYGLDLKKKSSKLIAKAKFDGFGEFGCFDPTGNNLCVVDKNGKRVVVFSPADLSVKSTIPLPGTPANVDLVEMLAMDRNAIARWSSSTRQDAKIVVNQLRNRGLKFKDAEITGTLYESREDTAGTVERKKVTLYFLPPFQSRIDVAGAETVIGKEFVEKVMKDGTSTKRPRRGLWFIPFGMVNVQEATFINRLTAEAGEPGAISIALDIMHEETFAGANFVVLGAVQGDSLSSQFWVNKDSWLPAKVIENDPETGTITETQFLDYRSVPPMTGVGGYWLPMKLDTYINGRLVRTLMLREVSIDQGVDPSLFEF